MSFLTISAFVYFLVTLDILVPGRTDDHVFDVSTLRLTLSSIYTHFNTLKKKKMGKHCGKKVKLLKMSNFTLFHSIFYVICIVNSCNSHISIVVCSFFEFGTVSKWCIREWVNCYKCISIRRIDTHRQNCVQCIPGMHCTE